MKVFRLCGGTLVDQQVGAMAMSSSWTPTTRDYPPTGPGTLKRSMPCGPLWATHGPIWQVKLETLTKSMCIELSVASCCGATAHGTR